MKEVPQKLQCSYCLRNRHKGGECNELSSNGCLFFKMDERGCIRNHDYTIKLPLYHEFPLLNTWCDFWQIGGVDSEVRVKKIYGIDWDSKTAELIIKCNIDYFINEYHNNYKEPNIKPKLKIIK